MKERIVMFLIVFILILGLGNLFNLQNESFKKQKEWVQKCYEKGGFVTQISEGWSTKTYACNGIK